MSIHLRKACGSCVLAQLLFMLVIQATAAQTTKQVFRSSPAASSAKSMVATVHPLATDAAIAAFADGGNAIDAAIAAALTLGVVDGSNSGIGGGCFILIRRADGTIVAIDGREQAPAAASRTMFMEHGEQQGQLSQIGPLAVAVPGALKAYEQAVDSCGRLDFSKLISKSAVIAEDGFILNDDYTSRLELNREFLARFPGSRDILLKPDGTAFVSGERLRQVDLANTYRMIGKNGTDWFYHGEFAERTERWMKDHGGILTAEDFADYKTKSRKPVKTTYRGYEIIGFPPPSSGGVHVAQILNILENFDLKRIANDDPPRFHHIVAEAMKLAFADRAFWLGDPAFANVPKGLISKAYARQLAARIQSDRAIQVTSHGTPGAADSEVFDKHTTHIAAADFAGNWVAITTTVNTVFGSKVIVPGLGVVLNSQMDDFSIAPGVPNVFGLVGAQANEVQPGKRPLSSMSPTIVLKDGKPFLTVGAAGGPKIISQAVWAIIGHLDLGLPIDKSVERPRIHHQWSPNKLFVEQGIPDEIIDALKALGHSVQTIDPFGITQAVAFHEDSKTFVGVHDPRKSGKAAGQ